MFVLTPKSLTTFLPWVLIICGLLGLAASFIITFEKMQLLANANFSPSCDLNPVISCGSVMKSWQADVFGFPNPLIGLISFSVLITVGTASLARAQFSRWFWRGLGVGTLLGLFFVHWLMIQSLYVIGALCPYCMVAWIVTITSFWYVLLYNLQEKHLTLKGRATGLVNFAARHHLDILFCWLLIIFVLIMWRFWYYFGPQLGF